MSVHANSLKNLKPFVKGVSGFTGERRPRLPEELKDIRGLNQLEVNRLISKYARMILAALQEKLTNPNTPVLELAIAKIFEQGIKHGDYTRLSFLLDRAIGKVPQIFEEEEETDSRQELARLSMQELLSLVKTIPAEIKE